MDVVPIPPTFLCNGISFPTEGEDTLILPSNDSSLRLQLVVDTPASHPFSRHSGKLVTTI